MKQLFKGRYLPNSTQKYLPLIVILTAIIGIIPLFFKNPYILTLFSLIMIYGMLALSIDLLCGYLGLGSLGHAGFFGAAAYCCGYLSSKLMWGFVPTVLGTLLFTVALTALFGFLTVKTWGVTFMMVNLALSQIIWGLSLKLTSITNGDNGLMGIVRPQIFGIPLDDNVTFYYFIFVVFLLLLVFVYKLVNSPFGMTVMGIRQSPKRMQALGFNVNKHKYITFVISGVMAGVAGMMYVWFNRFVSPNNCSTMASSKALLMSLVGGKGTLGGAILGSGIVVFLENIISTMTERWQMILGILYIITVTCSPFGMVGITRNLYKKYQTQKKNQGLEAEKHGLSEKHK